MQLRLFLMLLLWWLASSHCFTDSFTTACCRSEVWFFKVNIVTCCPYSSVVPMACFSLPVSLLPPACSLSACLWPASHLLLLNGCMMGQHPDSTVFPQCTPHCSVCKLTSDQSVCRCSLVQGRWNCSCGLFWIMWFGKDSGRFQLLFLVLLVCVCVDEFSFLSLIKADTTVQDLINSLSFCKFVDAKGPDKLTAKFFFILWQKIRS